MAIHSLRKSFVLVSWAIALSQAVTGAHAQTPTPESILEVDHTTIDSYLAGATSVQQIKPLIEQRGTGLDGSLRSAAPFGWTVNANPFSHEWNDRARYRNDIMLQTGRYSPTEIDMALPAPGFSWTVGRTYSVGEDGTVANGYQGDNWQQFSQPEIVYHAAGGANDRIYLVYGADRFNEYKRLDATSTVFRGVNGASGAFVADTISGHDVFVYWDQHGTRSTFFDPRDSANIVTDGFLDDHNGQGQLWKIVDAADHVAYVGHETDATLAIEIGFDDDGRMLEAYDTADRKYVYTYDLVNSTGGPTLSNTLLTSVEAFVDNGSGWETVGAKVEYDYFTKPVNFRGEFGWLREVTVTLPLPQFDAVSATGEVETYSSYYTYAYQGDLDDQALIKGVVGPEGYRRFTQDNPSQDIDLYSFSLLDDYMSYEFSHFDGLDLNPLGGLNEIWNIAIRNARIDGHTDEIVFDYHKNDLFVDYAATSNQYDPEHATLTAVYMGNYLRFGLYFDETGQPLSLVETTPITEDYIFTYVSRGEEGITSGVDGTIEMIATPLASEIGYYFFPSGTAYAAPTSLRTKASVSADSADGALINIFPRVQSGAYKGFMASRSWQAFDAPTAVIDGPHAIEEFDYLTIVHDSASAVDVGDDYLVSRPLISKIRTFNNYKIDITTVLDSNETTFTFEFHAEAINGSGATVGSNPEWLVPRRMTTAHPVVSTMNNGSGIADTETAYFRADDTLIFRRDETNVFFYTGLVNNDLVKQVDDTRLSDSGQFVGGDDPADYFSPVPVDALSREIKRTTTWTRDEVGRVTSKVVPGGQLATHRYEELADGQLARVSSQASDGADYLGPFDYQIWNDAGEIAVESTVGVVSTSTSPSGWIDDTETDPILAASVGTLASLEVNTYNKAGLIQNGMNVYHDIPTSGNGVIQTNFDAESYEYNTSDELIEMARMSGTIRGFERDSRGYINERTISSLNPGANSLQVQAAGVSENASETDANGNSMGGRCTCEEGGQCLVVTTPGTPAPLGMGEHQIQNDIFGRRVFVRKAEAPYYAIGYDNLGRIISAAVYSDLLDSTEIGGGVSSSPSVLNPDLFTSYDPAYHSPDGALKNRIAYVTIDYDERGRAVRQTQHKLDLTDGSTITAQYATSSSTFDAVGREIFTQGDSLLKRSYDRLGREIASYELSGIDDLTYSDSSTVVGDVVERETHRVIDSATGQLQMAVVTERTELDYGATEHRGQLDTNTYSTIGNTTVNPANLYGRAQITLIENDQLNRVISILDFGTGGTDASSIFDPDALLMPDRLTYKYKYASSGELETITDPLGRVKHHIYDDAQRLIRLSENDVSPSTSATDENRITEWVYQNNQLSEYVAYETGGVVQKTLYNYAPSNSSSGDDWPSRDLLRTVTYPDGGIEQFFYDKKNSMDKRVDPAGNEIAFSYDLPGRVSKLELTSVAGFDDAIRALAIEYSGLGQLSKVTQFSDTAATQEIDSVSMEYDGWTNLESFIQDPDGASPGSFEPKTLRYKWQLSDPSGGRQAVRLAGMNYNYTGLGGGADIDYIFEPIAGSVGGPSNMSRVSSIQYDSVVVAEYDYMGIDRVVETRYPTNSGYAAYSTLRDATGAFDALDDFNRPIRSRWNRQRASNTPASEKPFYDISVLWDDNSNVTGVTDHVLQDFFNYEYSNDGLNRITESKRGAGSGNSVTLPAVEVESWGLSRVGNWDTHDLELSGDNPPDYSDAGEFQSDGTFSIVNEMSKLEQDADNDSVIDVTYNRAHNNRGDLSDDGEKYKFVYDVLGRLVEIRNRTTDDLLSEYKYNGFGYRSGERIDTDEDGVLEVAETNWRYFIYDARWRLVEVYEDSDDDKPLEVYVHHAAGLDGLGTGSYIDHIVLRDRDTDADGTLDEFHFYCQNWRADVVAIIDEAGSQVEQIRYSPYGVPIVIPYSDQIEDGSIDFFDVSEFLDRHGSATYEVRADWDLNGTLDFFDVSAFLDDQGSAPTAGRGTQSNYDHRFGYAGYWYVAERGLYHVRYRWYNPEDGAWLTRDPLGYIDGSNMYSYVQLNPVVQIDFSGEWLITVIKVVVKGGKKGVKVAKKLVKGRKAKKAAEAARKARVAKKTKGLRKQVQQHKDKLKKYKNNPDKYDNLGHLKNCPRDKNGKLTEFGKEMRERIIRNRIRGLKHSIKEYEKQIREIDRLTT